MTSSAPSPPPASSDRSRVALVVGATGGIGAAAARRLAVAGFDLVLNGRRESVLAGLAEELSARAVRGDPNEPAVARALADAVADGVDVVVHASGILKGGPVRQQDIATFDEVITTNLRSVYAVVHAVLPHVRVGGRIMLVSSTSATRPMRGLTAYSAAKSGVNAFAAALAAELEPEGINVSLVSPGAVATPMMDKSVNAFSSLTADDVAEVIGWLAGLPPRMVVPDVTFRAPFRGPFVSMYGGSGTEGLDLSDLRAQKGYS
jgi:NAD(P)-dependent dehydrogenase (short-subunit alcohol dehydrogenase family)